MSGKTKHAEVATARSRLGATLQHLVEKKDDGVTGSDGEDNSLLTDIGSALSPVHSPRKLAKSRKRKRKDETLDYNPSSQHQTYIMKLFDRSVDLAQFDEDSPLYPICRAWIRNQPGSRNLMMGHRSPSPEPDVSSSQDEEGMDSFPNVYQMPAPIKQEFTGKHPTNLRIPAPPPKPSEDLDIHRDPQYAPPPEQLLLDHMGRWREIRNLWREASIKNEMRYAEGMALLKDMYERNIKDG